MHEGKYIHQLSEELDFDELHRREHEENHSKLIEHYTEYQVCSLSSKLRYKHYFFISCLVLLLIPPVFLFVIGGAIASGYLSATSINVLILLLGDIISFVVSMSIIPKTIAQYCFNKEEDSNVTKLFLNAQKNDRKAREQRNFV